MLSLRLGRHVGGGGTGPRRQVLSVGSVIVATGPAQQARRLVLSPSSWRPVIVGKYNEPVNSRDRGVRWFVAPTSVRRRDTEQPEGDKKPQSVPSPTAKLSGPLSKIIPAALAKTVAGATKRENIYTVPNWLTASRIVAAPFIGYCILHDHHTWALGLFAYAGISDLLDGWIARKWKLQTVVGTIIDPMADKMLMTVLVVALATKGALPLWLAVLILGRDVGLAISAIYYRWISLPPPKTFSRYWDFSLPSAEVRPTTISKYNTFFQLGLMGLTTVAPVVTAIDFSTTLSVLQYVVATTTVWSGASYVYSKDAVKILTQPEQEKAKAAAVEEKEKKKKLEEEGEEAEKKP